MLRQITSTIPPRVTPAALPNVPSDNIFVITRRRPRQREVDVELGGAGEDAIQPPNGEHNAQRDNQVELQLHSNPVYLKTQFDIMYYLGIAFVIFTSLSIVHAILKLKQFIVNHAKRGSLFHFISAWYLSTRLLPQMYFVKVMIWNRRFISSILKDSTRIKPGNVCKFPSDKISKLAIGLGCLRILMAVAKSIRPDWWLEGFSADSIVYVIMGSVGTMMEFCISLHANLLRDVLLMAALHTHRLSQIFHSNIQDTIGSDRPDERNLPLLRGKHNTFYQMAKGIEEGFGGFFIIQHVLNYIFCAYFLLDALHGEAENVFLPETVISIPVIACTYIFAAKAFATSQAVYTSLRDRDLDNDGPENVQSIKVSKFLKKLKSYPIAIGRDNFTVDKSFVQRFVGLVITSFLLFEDSNGKKP